MGGCARPTIGSRKKIFTGEEVKTLLCESVGMDITAPLPTAVLEAIQKAQILKPDLVLLDIGLPQLNGLEPENQLCQLVPSAGVFSSALNNGAQGYVLKAEAGELLSAITAVIRGEGFVSSGIKMARC
jgi:DNA-binding NarL/FixJ family response regulator